MYLHSRWTLLDVVRTPLAIVDDSIEQPGQYALRIAFSFHRTLLHLAITGDPTAERNSVLALLAIYLTFTHAQYHRKAR
jgi:exonuclease I